MKFQPSRTKFNKYHKINSSFLFLKEEKFFFPRKGFLALKALENGKVTFKHIEACRRTVRRSTKKFASVFINVFPYMSVTKKPIASRMGKGKGLHSKWICPVRKGQIILELSGPDFFVLERALHQASSKLPFKAKVVTLVY